MKFINRRTGVILEPRSPMVENQLRKSAEYTLCDSQKAADGVERPLAKLNKTELLEIAKTAGIAVPDEATKAQIIEMIQAEGKG